MDYKQRITHCGAAAAALLFSHMTLSPTAKAALITNSGFDNDFTGWQWQPAQGAETGGAAAPVTATAQVLKQAVLDGSNVLELTRNAPASAAATGAESATGTSAGANALAAAPSVVYQSVSLEPGKDYRLSVWAFGQGAGEAELFVGERTAPLPQGTFDWTHTLIDFTAQQATQDIGVRLTGNSEKLWLSKFSLTERDDTTAEIDALLTQHEAALTALNARLEARPELRSDAYVAMGMAVAERYTKRARTDGPGGTQGMRGIEPGDPEVTRWTLLQARELATVIEHTIERIDALEAAPELLWQKPDLANKQFTVQQDGFYYEDDQGEQKPVILGGYGHFDAVINDGEFLRTLGFNLVQQERGPRELRGEGRISTHAQKLLSDLNESATEGYYIDFLLSPHYMENSLFEKYPDFASAQKRGFARYNIDHPAARQWISEWIETIVPQAKDTPSLLGFCLSNEPAYFDSGRDAYSRPIWTQWLRQRHSDDIAALNAVYGTAYTSFEEIDVPAFAFPEDRANWAAYFDWVQFNQEHYAGWHRWMRDMVKEIDPEALVHAKLMPDNMDTRPIAQRTHGGIPGCGIDPELITSFSDLAGCDSWSFTSRGGEWAYTWQRTHLWYDLLHSFNGKPVIDSELHFIEDRTPADTIDWRQSYAIIWQGAQHNRTAFANWIWQEPTSSSSRGSVYLRPGNTYAVSKAMLDLNRLAGEVTAFNTPQAEVALLYSPTSLFWQQDYPQAMKDIYTLLTVLGHKITFISERQLAAGEIPASVSHLFLPRATHVEATTPPAIAKLAAGGVTVIPVGRDALSLDRYERPLPPVDGLAPVLTTGLNRRSDLHNISALLADVTTQPATLLEHGTRRHAWGVEHRSAEHNGRKLLSLANMLATPARLSVDSLGGKKVSGSATDLISGRTVDLADITLAPTETLLLDFGAL